ncbi:MAG: DNA polymerase I [Anaerolinea sp.]|nr:DNA polymerase I [Anaerolinea sp.]
MPPTLILIDGHALAYRAYFALNPTNTPDNRWLTSKGESTAGVFGFASVLLRIFEQEKPEYLAVAFDTGKTFRDVIYPEYKGTRAKMPDNLRAQIERIRQLVDAFNIPRLELENYEADDVLGTIARQAEDQGLGVKIITGDKDLLQLVTSRVIVNLPGGRMTDAKDYTPRDVETFLGVRPDQVVDYKALVGDKSDNIPGVAGIGEKTACSLLQTYQTLDEIYNHLDAHSAGVRAKLEANKEMAYKSQTLARIVTDAPIQLDLQNALSVDFDVEKVDAIFRDLEFRALRTRLQNMAKFVRPAGTSQQLSLFESAAPQPAPAQLKSIITVIVDTNETLQELASALKAASTIAIDTETTSTDPMRADLVGISFCVQPGTAYYLPVGHHTPGSRQLSLKEVQDSLAGILSDPTIKKAGHNIKYDAMILKLHGLPVTPLSFDTMIAEWLINPNSRNLGLKSLAWIRLGYQMTHIEDLIGRGKNQLNMADVEIARAAPYAADDAEATLRLIPVLEKDLVKNNAIKLLSDMEMPLVSVLADMEEAGILLDVPFFQRFSVELQTLLAGLEEKVYQAAGTPFNLNSTQQLSRVLFENLKLAPPDRGKKTASGLYSTSADVLASLKGKHPIVDWILEYRELSKLKSTYVDTLPLEVNPHTSRVHTSYNQTGTVTGRIASSDPNLQNIPTRTDQGHRVREGFVAAPGCLLLSVDYSQIELRIAAHMSGDEAMLQAFRDGIDIHTATAAAVNGVHIDQVTKDQRQAAKAINFGLIYGMGAFSLSQTLGVTLSEAEIFIKAYFNQFPQVKIFLDNLRKLATTEGYVETLLGRRRYFPGLATQSNVAMRQREEREAINAPIQGTAADIIKLAMLKIPSALQKAGLAGKLILQVHDELVLECPQMELEQTALVVQHEMENAFTLNIPLTTEARAGKNWGAMLVLKN